MSATVFLEEAMLGGTHELECEEVQVLGNVIRATPSESSKQYVVPLENVVGIEGDDVDQRVEELPSPGGQYTELVTEIK